MPTGNRENPQFMERERLKTPRTDCLLKVYEDKSRLSAWIPGLSTLKSRVEYYLKGYKFKVEYYHTITYTNTTTTLPMVH